MSCRFRFGFDIEFVNSRWKPDELKSNSTEIEICSVFFFHALTEEIHVSGNDGTITKKKKKNRELDTF